MRRATRTSVLGYTFMNQLTASPSPLGVCSAALGVPGGKSTQRLCPLSSAFQADVPSGSMWMLVPERAGPMTIQRYGGRRRSLP